MNKSLILIIIFILNVSGCVKEPGEMGYEILPDMVHPVPYEAYSANDIFPDGKTMQLPPKHSIARGKMPFDYGPGDLEAKRAGLELSNPFEKTKNNLERGKHIYSIYCLVCHGVEGQGDGPLIPKFPNPPALTSKRILAYPDGRLFHIISRGSGDMSSHAEQIETNDRWYLIQYLRDLQENFKKK